MKYSLHFVPEIEEDVLAGYNWYEDKAKGLGEEFLRVFYARLMKFQEILCSIQKCIVSSEGFY